MANTNRFRKGHRTLLSIAKGTTTGAVEIGDLLTLASGEVTTMDTTTNNMIFYGVAESASPANSTERVLVSVPNADAQYDYPLDTETAMLIGENLQYYAAQGLKKSDTDSIAVCSGLTGTVSTTRVRFKVVTTDLGDTS